MDSTNINDYNYWIRGDPMNLEIKSNPVAQLKLLKQFTFTDKLVYLDELIQNASRAKASEVKIQINSDSVMIENNGKVLEDPQSLFSIAESNWDSSVSDESPFGIGFFSVVAAFNKIEVTSGTHRISMDVNKILSGGSEGLSYSEDEHIEGFSVLLSEPIIRIDSYDIQHRVNDIGLYSDNLDIYVDNELVKKLDKFDIPKKFEITSTVTDDNLKGYVALSDYSWCNGVSIYYKGRKVKELNTPFITGNLHAESGYLNLRAPDRKDIIQDENYRSLISRIDVLREELALKAVNAGATFRKKYAGSISKYLSIDTYFDKIELKVIKGEELHLMDEYFEKNPTSNFKEFLLNKVKVESLDTTVTSKVHVDYNLNTKDTVTSVSGSSGIIGLPTAEKIPEERYDYSDLRTFYVKSDELRSYATKLKLMKKYGLSVVVAMDDLEVKVCEHYGMVHISKNINPDIKYVSKVHSEPTFNKSELRAVQVLNSISKHLMKKEIFKIAKVQTTEIVKIEDVGYEVEKFLGEKPMVLSECSKFVYINPSLLDTRLSGNQDKLTLNDYKFILRYLDDIVSVIGKVSPGDHRKNLMKLLGQ